MADESVGKGTAQVSDLLGLSSGQSTEDKAGETIVDDAAAQAAAAAATSDATQDAAAKERELQAEAQKLSIDVDADYEFNDRTVKGREIVEGYMTRADYTKKTTELAEERAALAKEAERLKQVEGWVNIVASDPYLSIATTAIGRGLPAAEAYRLMDEARGKTTAAPAQPSAPTPPINSATGRPYEEGDIEYEDWKHEQKLNAELSARDREIADLKAQFAALNSELQKSKQESEAERAAREQAERIASHNTTVIKNSERFIKDKFGESFDTSKLTPEQAAEFGRRINATARSRGIMLDDATWRSQNWISDNDMELIIAKTDFNLGPKQDVAATAPIAKQSDNNRMSAGSPSVGSLAPATDVDQRPPSATSQFDDMLARAPANNRK